MVSVTAILASLKAESWDQTMMNSRRAESWAKTTMASSNSDILKAGWNRRWQARRLQAGNY